MVTPKKTKMDKNLFRIITPEFRVSYPHVFKPQAPKPADKPKFSVTMLFPKDNALMGTSPQGNPRSIQRVIKNAKIAVFGANEEDWPDELINPINDGDKKKFKDKDGYAGHWVIKAISNEDQKPVVVYRDLSIMVDPNDLYPGCFARAHIFSYCWEYMGKQGIGFILDHIQKIRDGKSFGGKKPVQQVFKPLQDEEESDESYQDMEDF